MTSGAIVHEPRRTSSKAWADSLSAPPTTSSEATTWDGALVRHWRGTSAVMEQPPLDHHYLVIHLGGAKQVSRRRDGPSVSRDVDNHSLTLVPAGTAFSWRTRGPIEFAHLYIAPGALERVLTTELDREGRDARLIERVGCRDMLMEAAFSTMLREIERGADASQLLLDCLLESVLIKTARKHVVDIAGRSSRSVALAPYRLNRVLDFIESELANDLRLGDLADAAGSSQSHFSRAFRLATGFSPYRYLLQRRIEHAQVLLLASAEPLAATARRCGFRSQDQFAMMFKRLVGSGPKAYRLACTRDRRSGRVKSRP